MSVNELLVKLFGKISKSFYFQTSQLAKFTYDESIQTYLCTLIYLVGLLSFSIFISLKEHFNILNSNIRTKYIQTFIFFLSGKSVRMLWFK